MATERKFTGKKLALLSAFAVLLVAAFGAGCKGFFQPNALESIAIQPPTPEVEVGQTTGLQAWGTYEDNSRSQITSGVAWTSSGEGTTINVDPNTGDLSTPTGSVGGTATITAAAQGLSATATATAYLGNVTDLQICTGTFNTGTCPAATWTLSATAGGTQDYYATAVSGGTTLDVTTVATWVVTPTATTGGVTCSNSASPAVCSVTAGTLPTGNYTITVTYPGTTPVTATITLH
ncbi:MAG: Ig-like domain-containing protein [Terriglobales bacterium]